MPYIAQVDREVLDKPINDLASAIHSIVATKAVVDIVGLLNYSITRLLLRSFKLRCGDLRYWMSPMIRGILQDVGDEFYRRKMHQYEDKKIKENGDVEEYKE